MKKLIRNKVVVTFILFILVLILGGGIFYINTNIKLKNEYSAELKKAKSGNVDSQYIVAFMAEKGLGREIDNDFSNKWYMKAASNGSKEAQFRICLKYNSGEIKKVDRKFKKRIEGWCKKSVSVKSK